MTINKTAYGLVLGLILPPLTSLAFYKFVYTGYKSFPDFIDGLIFLDSAAMFVAVCALSNLAFFMLFAYLNKLNIARGIFLATVFYALVVLVFKFLIQ